MTIKTLIATASALLIADQAAAEAATATAGFKAGSEMRIQAPDSKVLGGRHQAEIFGPVVREAK